jgi:rhodanese-related sulfurtransferase
VAELDLAYAPPYSSANDPANLAAFVAENDLSGFAPLVTAAQLKAELAGPVPPLVVDVRTLGEWSRGHLAAALHLPVDDVRWELEQVPRDRRIVLYCQTGFRAHLALRTLRGHGYTNLANLTGGWVSAGLEGGFDVEGA